jgi:hypothetical protein
LKSRSIQASLRDAVVCAELPGALKRRAKFSLPLRGSEVGMADYFSKTIIRYYLSYQGEG